MSKHSVTLNHPSFGKVSFNRLTTRQIEALNAVKHVSETISKVKKEK
jgi:hypothetical protein